MLLSSILLLLSTLPFLGYLSGGEAFPRVLNAQEERDLVQKLSEGDEDARIKLIEHNLRLVAHIAKKYACNGREMDDLISIGTIGLIKAVNTYDHTTGKAVGTYAARCIENEILMSIRAERKTKQDVPLEEIIGADRNGNEIMLSALIGTPHDEVEHFAELNVIAAHLMDVIDRVLTPRERLIIEMRYGLRGSIAMPQREIAKRFGISRSYVSRIEKRALLRIAQEMNLAPPE